MKIGDLNVKFPIIQGGMAIRVSMAKLAAAVVNEGGIGLIAGSALDKEEFIEEINKAKNLITNKDGILGVNIMVAVSNFMELAKAAFDNGVKLVVCGAGFSRDIFQVAKEKGGYVIPIVSSVKLAKISEKLGADAIVVEGGNAGGHLGTEEDSWDIISDIKKSVKIPVFGAGGIMTPEDAKRMLDLGADGIQMGSRFVATDECEVEEHFKQMYVDSKEGDVVRIQSSAGLPANALLSPFVEKLNKNPNDKSLLPTKCTGCLVKCTKHFCVNERLVWGHDGDYENGVFFAGTDVWKINDIISVKEVFNRFKTIFE